MKKFTFCAFVVFVLIAIALRMLLTKHPPSAEAINVAANLTDGFIFVMLDKLL